MNFRQQLRSARAWWAGLGLMLCCLMIGGLVPSGAVFATYSASMSTSGSQSIDVSASGDGVAISADVVTVTTNCRAGYNLSVATSVNDNNLYYNGSVSNNANGTYFEPVDGINTLANNTNKWGYYYNSSSANAPTKTNVFSAVPASSGTPAALVTPTASETDISDSFNVYFGVSINSNLKAGTYKMIQDTNNNNNGNGSITYYLTMATSCMPYTVVFNPTSTASGSSVSGTGTMNSQTIPVGDATALNANTFIAPSGYEFDSWNTAQDGSGTTYADQASVTDLAAGGGSITLYAQWEAVATRMDCSNPNSYLYCKVADQVKTNSTACTVTAKDVNNQDKCAQNMAALQTTITAPAAGSTPATDTSNSGVFLYNAGEFGTSSDVNDGYDIYYYRGVLENAVGSYGSDGSAVTYPNYVILSSASSVSELARNHTTDTCWRIVRTTGSGGVKMIYNGTWTGTTCANATTDAQVTMQAFGLKGNSAQSRWYYNINRVGYTFNNTQSLQDSTGATDVNTVFGSDANPGLNNARSNIKTYIEDTWYTNISAYTSILEASAGYCNDRTAYSNADTSTALTTIPPYRTASSGQTMYFGAYGRNMNSAKVPSLTCSRSTVDLYRYVPNSEGVSNELKYPVALITADEASFAGSGSSTATNGSAYNANSYLRSGNDFWLLSPYFRYSVGNAYVFYLNSNGYLNNYPVSNAYGVRPAISLTSGTSAVDGTGTATSPWIVNPPTTP